VSTLPEPFYALGDHFAIELAGARAVFTTRRGGVSSGPYASLNLGRLTDDRPEAVGRNRERLSDQLAVTLSLIRQVHGVEVRRVSKATDPGAELPEADGQATTTRGLGMMALVADCLPLAVAGEGAVAVMHAGWRGLAAGIVVQGVSAVRDLGERGPLSAAIGPGAGPCCYEVGDEVHAAFAMDGAHNARNLDLKAIARRQLETAGLRTVHDVGLCTICGDESLFFSHRRDRGVTGRQAGVAWLT
jgi:YfiH family protein